MNIKFYNCNTGRVYNLGERFKTLKEAQDDCIAQLKQTDDDAYVDQLGFVHYVNAENGDQVFGIFFMHYRNLCNRICKAIEKRESVNLDGKDWRYWNHHIQDTYNHLHDMNTQTKSCTSETSLLRITIVDYATTIRAAECMSNTPIKHANIKIRLYNNIHKPTDQLYIDKFGFVHNVKYCWNTVADTIISMYVDENDLDNVISNLSGLLNGMWRGKPVIIDPQTHYTAQKFYDLLVAYRDDNGINPVAPAPQWIL